MNVIFIITMVMANAGLIVVAGDLLVPCKYVRRLLLESWTMIITLPMKIQEPGIQNTTINSVINVT